MAAQDTHVAGAAAKGFPFTAYVFRSVPRSTKIPGSQDIWSPEFPLPKSVAAALRLRRSLATRWQPSFLTTRSFTTPPPGCGGRNAYEPQCFGSECGRLCSHQLSGTRRRICINPAVAGSKPRNFSNTIIYLTQDCARGAGPASSNTQLSTSLCGDALSTGSRVPQTPKTLCYIPTYTRPLQRRHQITQGYRGQRTLSSSGSAL